MNDDDILPEPAPEPSRSVPARAKPAAVQPQPMREDFAANFLLIQQPATINATDD
jgi:hypothetical protein